MARGMFNINDPDAGPVKVTIGQTSLPGDVDYGQIPSDITAGRDERYDLTELDKTAINLEIQKGTIVVNENNTIRYEGIDIPLTLIYGPLPEGASYYEVGDLNGDGQLDVYAASTEQGGEQIYGVYGVGEDGTVTSTGYDDWLEQNQTDGEEDPTLAELIDEFGEDAVNTAQGIYDDVSGYIEGAIDDPLGTLVSILDVVVDAGIPEKCQDLKDCRTADPDKGIYCWKDCVNFSILAGIPGLPSLPGMQDVGTYRDFEDAVKEIGTTIGDVIEGNAKCGENNNQDCTVTQVLEDAGTWVMEKIEGVLKGIEDATLDDAYDWIRGIFGAAVGGFVFTQVKDQIEDIFFPVAPPDDEERCDERDYFEANKDKCIELGYLDCSTVGRVQTAGAKTRDDCGACTETAEDGTPYEIEETTGNCKDPTTTGDPALTEEEQDCIDKGRKFENGECLEDCDNPDYEVDPIDGSCGPKDTTKSPEEICQEKGLTYDSNVNNPDRDSDGCVSTDVVDPMCDDPNAQNYGEIGDCGECKANFKKDPNTGKCVPDETTGTDCSTITSDNADKCGKTDCGDGVFVDKGQPCPSGTGCPEGQKKFDGENCEDVCPDDPSISASSPACQSTTGCKPKGEVLDSGCDGTTFFIRFADGECGEIYDSVPGYSGCGGGYECDDPNATVREDGSCGPCKAGYVYDGAVEKCVQESVTNPCSDPAYAAANPEECGTGPDCVDCTCAEYAAANPEECGTAPPPETPSGGSGGTGGAGGMFSVDAGFELSGDPALLPKMQFPIENFLANWMQESDNQNTSITSLFEGLV